MYSMSFGSSSVEEGCPGLFFKIDKNDNVSCADFCPTSWHQEESDGVIYCIDDSAPSVSHVEPPGVPSASILSDSKSSISISILGLGVALAVGVYLVVKK